MSALDPNKEGILQAYGDKIQLAGNAEVIYSAAVQSYDFAKQYFAQSPCKKDNSDIKGIQLAIKNLQNDISRIKRFSNINSAIDALINESVEPGKTIKKIVQIATGDISGFVKNILGRARGWVMNEIQMQAKKVLPFLFPSEMPSFVTKLNKGINGLSCAFAKITRALFETVGRLLLDLIDEYINGPLCLIENFINDLLNQILGPIEDAINAINALLGSIVNAVLGPIFNLLDFVSGIVSFFDCSDEKSCPSVDQVSRGGGSLATEDPTRGSQTGEYDKAGGSGGDSSSTSNQGISNPEQSTDSTFGTREEARRLLGGETINGLSFTLE
jgi:hypothetical protein